MRGGCDNKVKTNALLLLCRHIRYIVKCCRLRTTTTHMKRDLWTIFGKFGRNYCASLLAGRIRLSLDGVDELMSVSLTRTGNGAATAFEAPSNGAYATAVNGLFLHHCGTVCYHVTICLLQFEVYAHCCSATIEPQERQ